MKSFHQKVYLIRHGETEWTETRQHTGLTDIPLTDEGKLQAQWLTAELKEIKLKKIYSSPLQRALETCSIAGYRQDAEMDPDLVEWDYGLYEGKTTPEIRETDPKWNIFKNGAPDGESPGDVATRANRVISRIRDIPGDVALFSHGHFLRSLAVRWIGLTVSQGKLFALSTASISVLGYERSQPVIISWNKT